jgi:glycosyltransferase involved in cell wall biosynthesis
MSALSRHVVVIADSRFPIREPFAGGMQSLTWHLVKGLRARGVDVTVFAGPGTDPDLGAHLLDVRPVDLSDAARRDVSMQPEEWLAQHHAYLDLMLALGRRHDVDVVHNNSLHYLPVAMAAALPSPMLTTLHTPPTPWLEPTVARAGRGHHLVAVSRHTARAWRHGQATDLPVVPNGVDVHRWPMGPGGEDLVWTGRIAPEKGTHHAVEIARRAGRRLRIAGPIADPVYWRDAVRPRLGPRATYEGHLRQDDLAQLVGSSALCLVTPAWDEPYGLVAAEALACGTPVLAFERGGLPEVLARDCALLARAGDVGSAAALVPEAEALDRSAARRHAELHCSIEAMLTSYVDLYADLARGRAA